MDITTAFEGYASGLMTLGPVLKDPAGGVDLTTIITGTQQLNAARMALDDANSKMDLLIASGAATCP